ncbi:MAG: hypothetical protein ABEL76_15245 [Bradymonadaceae bacterium]
MVQQPGEIFWPGTDAVKVGTVLCLVVASLFSVHCTAGTGPECRTSADCDGPESCVLGECRRPPSRGTTPTSDERAGAVDATARSGETACPNGRPPEKGDVAINEVLIDVPSSPAGDANGNGRREPSGDEFVELVNTSGHTLDMEGVAVRVDGEPVVPFRGTCMDPSGVRLVFGNGTAGSGSRFGPNVGVRGTSSSLELSNTGGEMTIRGADGAHIAGTSWADPPAESLTLSPQIEGDDRVPHTSLSGGRRFSPGECPSGAALATGCPRARGRGRDTGTGGQ